MALRPALHLDALLHGTPFRAVARIGAGGMGEIYEAIGPFGGEPVVVKILRAELTGQAELVERMRREGEMLQFLSHPNIVVSYGHGITAAGRPYVVLERLLGSTLRQELSRRCSIPVGEAVAYARQLLSALARVHDAGVVHRDIKPGNVMLCPARRGARIKLIDFGVAKVEREARALVGPIAFPTREGICLGTPRYVSPEQASGLDVDRRTDIYAVGMMLYTLIAGRGPFDDIVGVERVLEAQIGHEPPPPSRVMTVPLAASIEAVILRAIAKNPAERFADVATFRRELSRAWAEARGPSRSSVAGRRAGKTRPPMERAATYGHRPGFDRCRIRIGGAPLPRVAYGAGSAEMVTVRAFSAAGAALGTGPPIASHGTTAVCPAPIASEAPPWDPSLVTAHRDVGPIPAAAQRPCGFPAPISRRGVFCSAAAFFAVTGGLAMWFVR
jgi:eukaryotic-like serine/threonine-protein kinase